MAMIGLLDRLNDSIFLVTVTNYSDYQLQPDIDVNANSNHHFEAISIYNIVIAIIASTVVLFIAGHVIVRWRKKSRHHTWSLQSTISSARGRFIQRDVWTGRSPDDNSQTTAGNDPFHIDTYRTLAYAYINWKQDMTSVPGSCSSTSDMSDKHAIGRLVESVTSYSSRTDDVTLPSSVTGDLSLTSSMVWHQQSPIDGSSSSAAGQYIT